MAQTRQTGNPFVSTNKSITNLLVAPLGPEWTIDRLAEDVLCVIAGGASVNQQELVLDRDTITDRQSSRLLRPLLACLATKSAAEAGTSPNLYGGDLLFKRNGRHGPVWVLGRFENTPNAARVAFRLSPSPPEPVERPLGHSTDLSPSSPAGYVDDDPRIIRG